MKSKKINVGESIVPYSPQSISSPFGNVSYSGGTNIQASPEYQQQISTRQRLINELLPELGMTRNQQNSRIQNYTDLLNQQLLKYAQPAMYGQFASRGMADSTLANNALNDLYIKAANQSIFAGEDLYNNELNRMLQSGQFLQGGLNDIYTQLMGLAGEGRAQNQQMFDVQNANANRLLQGNTANAQLAADRNSQMWSGLGMLGAVAAPYALPAMGFAAPVAASGAGTNLMSLFAPASTQYGNTGNLQQDMRLNNLGSSLFDPWGRRN